MKLLKQNENGFEYRLSQEEAHSLRVLLRQFPVNAFSPVTISKSDSKAAEREKWLNESLAGHRAELKELAAELMGEEKFIRVKDNELFQVSREGRETVLQVLNDIRVECWRILGEPHSLELKIFDLPKDKVRYYHFMHLAGYFEHYFLNLESGDEKERPE